MADKIYPQSQLPIRKTKDLLPNVFQTPANNKFMAAVVDPLVQPGVLQKTAGYVGRRYEKLIVVATYILIQTIHYVVDIKSSQESFLEKMKPYRIFMII